MQTVIYHQNTKSLYQREREALKLRPCLRMQVVEHEGRIGFIPERDFKELRCFLKGIDTEFEREKDRV